jgi:hypothetical protein
MAKYTVTYADGVTGEVSLFGPYKERQRKLEWLSTQISPEGYRKQQDELKAKGELKSRMKTIIRVIPGQNPVTLIPALEKDLERAKTEYKFYNERFETPLKEHPDWSEDDKKAWREGKLSFGGSLDGNSLYLLGEVRKAQDKVKRIEDDIAQAKKQGIVNPIIEFVSINSYDQKDQLKSAGYRFDRYGYWADPVGLKTMPAWIKRIEVKPENQDKLISELQFVKSLGEVEGDNLLNRATAGIREGRIVKIEE